MSLACHLSRIDEACGMKPSPQGEGVVYGVKMMVNKQFVFCILAAALLAMFPLQPAFAMEPPVLSVQGTGQARLAPDQAGLSLSVVTEGQSAQEVQAENARKMQAVTEAVKGLGVEDRFIRTSNISMQPRYDYKNGERKLKGYTATNTLRIEVKDLSKLGRIIDRSLNAGANKVDALEFGLQAPERLQQLALRNAVADARSKAEVIAGALGKRIVGLRQVAEENSGYMPRSYAMPLLAAAKADNEMAAETPVSPGELELSATVHIDFILSE